MKNNIISYFILLFVFLIMDFIWIGFIAKKPYKRLIGYLMKEKPNFIAALIFYFLYIFGLMFFVINPAIDKGSLLYALFAGCFFGLIAYGTYDLTNLATVKDWPLEITIIDLIWGTFVTGATSFLGYLLIMQILY